MVDNTLQGLTFELGIKDTVDDKATRERSHVPLFLPNRIIDSSKPSWMPTRSILQNYSSRSVGHIKEVFFFNNIK